MKVDTRLHWKTGQKTLFQNYLNILWGIELYYIETRQKLSIQFNTSNNI